jgi:hypothetical protein
MTDNTEHKPGCEALGGYGHGIGPCSCSEAQPEALRLAESQRYSDVVHHANVKASLAYVARKTGLGYQETERLLELALQRGDLAEGDYSGRKMEKIADDRLASLEAKLVAQTNRAAAAEQQVTALTQRLDMANRLNTDARNQLAQLSARQAAPDGWRLVPESPTEEMVTAGQESFGVHDCYYAMLSAAPPPPEREPLTQEQKDAVIQEWIMSRVQGATND